MADLSILDDGVACTEGALKQLLRDLATDVASVIADPTIITSAGDYTASDDTITYVIFNKTVGAATGVTLPSARTNQLTIKDGKGDADANPITITPEAGTIDGAASYVIDGPYGGVTLVKRPGVEGWWTK